MKCEQGIFDLGLTVLLCTKSEENSTMTRIRTARFCVSKFSQDFSKGEDQII